MPSHLSMRLEKMSERIRQDLSGNSIQELNEISFGEGKGQKCQNLKNKLSPRQNFQYEMDILECTMLPYGKKEAMQL